MYFTKAEIVFSKSSKRIENIAFKIIPSNKPAHAISTKILEKGQWVAQLIWSQGKSHFCSEQIIEIN